METKTIPIGSITYLTRVQILLNLLVALFLNLKKKQNEKKTQKNETLCKEKKVLYCI